MLFGNSPISWKSKKQSPVTLSTTEAEYVALATAVQEVKYLRIFLGELGYAQTHPMVVYEDNQSCNKLIKNPACHGRTTHVDLKSYFVQEAEAAKEIATTPCATTNMIADIMSKALPGQQFQRHALTNILCHT